jgi:hypothetical protein
VPSPVPNSPAGTPAAGRSSSSGGADGGSGGPLYVAALDAWDGLTVEYSPPWPLHLLLTPQVFSKEHSMRPYWRLSAWPSICLPPAQTLHCKSLSAPTAAISRCTYVLVTSVCGCVQVLAKYGALCRLLLRLRRVAAMLDAAWAAMRSGGRPRLASQLATRAGSRSDSPRCATTLQCCFRRLSEGQIARPLARCM